MMGDGGGSWIAMAVLMTLFWVAVVAGVVWFVSSIRGSSRGAAALEVLDQRLARGDIDIDEHRRLKAELATPARRRGLPVVWIVAGLIGVGLVAVMATGAFAGDWDMWDHMGGMHGGGRDTSGSSEVQGGMTASVTIEDFAFKPGNLQVPVGAAVTWTNQDSAEHDARARSEDWESERLSKGEADTITFDRAGDYDYYCSIHPSMKARLVIR